MPVALRFAPANQLQLSFSRYPEIAEVEILIGYVVVVEEVDHRPQFIEKQDYLYL